MVIYIGGFRIMEDLVVLAFSIIVCCATFICLGGLDWPKCFWDWFRKLK